MSVAQEALGEYKLLDKISESKSGSVWLSAAQDDELEELYSVKVLSKQLYSDEESAVRLLSSLERVCELAHPQLCKLKSFGRSEDGSIYLVQEYHPDCSLRAVIDLHQAVELDSLLDLARQICQGLKALHQKDLIHGDLNPSNIFLVDGGRSLKLADYGIAGSFNEQMRHAYLGLHSEEKSNYMSPEQCLNFELDARSDIYSLGLIIYELLCGSPLASGQNQMHSLLKQVSQNPNLLESDPDIPESLKRVVLKCLSKNRADRYFSVEDLEMDLDLLSCDLASSSLGLNEGPAAEKTSRGRSKQQAGINGQGQEHKDAGKERRRRKRRRILLSITGALLISGITAGVILRHDSSYYSNKALEAFNDALTLDESVVYGASTEYPAPILSGSVGPAPYIGSAVAGSSLTTPPPPPGLAGPDLPVATAGAETAGAFAKTGASAEPVQAPDWQDMPGSGDAFRDKPASPGPVGVDTFDSTVIASGDAFDSTAAISAINPDALRKMQERKHRLIDKAIKNAERAIVAYRIQNPLRSDRKFKMRLADLQQFVGDIYLRDRPSASLLWVNNGCMYSGSLESVAVDPSFPGFFDASPDADYKNAELWFEKARRTLGRFVDNDVDLLWGLAYAKYKQENKLAQVIGIHEAIFKAISSQPVPDKQALIYVKRNIAVFYLQSSNWQKAVESFAEARKMDEELNKIPGPITRQLRVELAYAYLKKGMFAEAEKLAKENQEYFSRLSAGGILPFDTQFDDFNMELLRTAALMQGKPAPELPPILTY